MSDNLPMESTIEPIVTGDYLLPPNHRNAGKRAMSVAYLVRHPEATLLFDTGFPFDVEFSGNEGDMEIPTYPRSLTDALAARGVSLEQIDLAANCHLHIDHAGGNHHLPPTVPIYVQRAELERARTVDAPQEPIVRDALLLDERNYRPLDGEEELLPGIRVLPTPGHTDGHQSLLVATDAGPVFLGGQTVPGASDFTLVVYAWYLEQAGNIPVPPYPGWLPRVMELAPERAMFAHDLAIWERDPGAALRR
jgi:glyoxylase-like metal-dependent hydrolase (beta-lactamase superfamily II)